MRKNWVVKRPDNDLEFLLPASHRHDATDVAIHNAERLAHLRGELTKIEISLVNNVARHGAETEMELIDDLRAKAGNSATNQAIAASWSTKAHSTNLATFNQALG